MTALHRLVVGIVVLGSLRSVAVAEEAEAEAGEPAAPAVDLGLRHFEQGLLLVQRELWEPALVEFEESLRQNRTSVAAFNRALCLRNLRRYPEALRALDGYLEEFGAGIDQARREQVDAMRREIRSLLTAVTVRVNVPEATVLVDGEEVGAAPLDEPVLLLSGPHEFEARREGFSPARGSMTVVSGSEATVTLELARELRTGRLHVRSNVEGAAVYLDGRHVGETPYAGEHVEGQHDVEVQADGYRGGIETVTVVGREERLVTVSLDRHFRAHPGWFWTMVALTVAGGAGSGVLGGLTLEASSEYNGDPERTFEAQEAGRQMALGTDILIGFTAATAVTATVLGFFTDFRGRGAAGARGLDASLPLVFRPVGGL